MKKVKYKVTGPFGLREEGEIIDAYILFRDEDTGTALVYHPSNNRRGECGTLEFCIEKKGVFVTGGEDYINLDAKANKLIKKVLS